MAEDDRGSGAEVFSFYGIDGKVLETYTPAYSVYSGGTYMALTQSEEELYMAGQSIGRTNWQYVNSFQPIPADLLGTVRWGAGVQPNGVTEAFWPWREERGTVTGNDRTKWGTCWRDSESSLDYGMNRYYSSVTGRFMTADPYGGSAVAGNPQSWNRYAYGLGDPVNGNDPTGLDDAADVGDWFSNFLSGLGVGGAGGSTDGYGATTPYDIGAVFNAIGTATAPSDGPTTYDVGAVFTATGTATPPPDGSATNGVSGNSSGFNFVSFNSSTTGVSSGGVGPTVGAAPNSIVRMPLPPNAQACSTNAGVTFNAPPGFSVSNIAANGQTNGLAGAGAAVGQGGYYDFQRFQAGSTTQFFPGYTPVANIAVGAYLQGTGVPQWMASAISNTYAFFKSANGATAQQAQFRNLGFALASGKGTYSCHPQIP